MLVAASFTSCKEKKGKEKNYSPPQTTETTKKHKQKNSKTVFLFRDVTQKHTCIRVKDN